MCTHGVHAWPAKPDYDNLSPKWALTIAFELSEVSQVYRNLLNWILDEGATCDLGCDLDCLGL